MIMDDRYVRHDTLIWEYLNSSIHLVKTIYQEGVYFPDHHPFIPDFRLLTWRRSYGRSMRARLTSFTDSLIRSYLSYS